MRSLFLLKATTEGVVRLPSAFEMTTGSPFSRTATTEFVVPKSMPTIFPIVCSLCLSMFTHWMNYCQYRQRISEECRINVRGMSDESMRRVNTFFVDFSTKFLNWKWLYSTKKGIYFFNNAST